MTEKERAREQYLALREQALKEGKKETMSKLWMDIHYMMTGAIILAAIATTIINFESFAWWKVLAWIAAVVVFVALATIPTRIMNKHKKALHELKQKLEDLESKYHL